VPSNAFQAVGLLRLRSCFAKRSSYSAQDDTPHLQIAFDAHGRSPNRYQMNGTAHL
jgi:hypothetical protein